MTLELRRAVLRPHQSLDELELPDDASPAVAYFAARGGDGAALASARVAPADPPLPAGLPAAAGTPCWQLRAMATREDLRGRGIGSAVLAAATAHVAANGGGLLWCKARVAAEPFYRRAGFTRHGEVWEEPHIGPHVLMWRTV